MVYDSCHFRLVRTTGRLALGSDCGDRRCRSFRLTAIINGIERRSGISFCPAISIYRLPAIQLHWLDVVYVLVTALLLSLLASYGIGAAGEATLTCGIERPVIAEYKNKGVDVLRV